MPRLEFGGWVWPQVVNDDKGHAYRALRKMQVQTKAEGKVVRDVSTMSQTTYLKSMRHTPVNNFTGDLWSGTPYYIS